MNAVMAPPSLAVEDHRRNEPLHPGLDGIELTIEPEIDEGRVAEGDVVRLCVHPHALRLVLLAPRRADERVELRVGVERHIAADSLVRAVKQGIEKILGIGIVGVPVLHEEVRLTISCRLARRGALPLDDLRPDARESEVALEGLGDAHVQRRGGGPQLDVDAVRVAGLSEELSRPQGVELVADPGLVRARQ
jgi:hypothetical protein